MMSSSICYRSSFKEEVYLKAFFPSFCVLEKEKKNTIFRWFFML